MQVQVHTDNHLEGTQALVQQVEAEVSSTLGRFGQQITRVEVHLQDTNSHKSGDSDKRCLMEARLAGLQPIAVSHQASSVEEAIDGAAAKLERTLDRTLGRLGNVKGRTSFGGDQKV